MSVPFVINGTSKPGYIVEAVAIVLAAGAADAQVSFSRVTTTPDIPRFDFVVAVADLNGDGRDDIAVGEDETDFAAVTPEDRFPRNSLHLFVGEEDGTFTHAPKLVEGGVIEVRTPIVVPADFNGDAKVDLAVFDFGNYVLEHSYGYGNPPQLFLSSQDGPLRASEALADAVRHEHALRPPDELSGAGDLHLKSATSGDIDGDGDIDLWIESTGGANVTNHFMVNNGDGTFTIEPDRAPYELLHNPPPEFWRHHMGHLVDVDNDDDLDLVLGQMRDLDPTHINQFSLVLVNDGTGYYRERIELPHPTFNDGYTHVPGITHFDVNGDGYQDLFIAHERNDDGPSGVVPWTGRYIQVLINRADGTFGDETLTWMSDQSATTPEHNPEGDEMSNGNVRLGMYDVDRDGCLDLVAARSPYAVRAESPYAYLNNGSGQFEAAPHEAFNESAETWFGDRAMPADVNGDGVIDFVVPLRDDGPDDVWGNDDDVSVLMTLLNTTPLRPIRCAQAE